MLISGIVSSTLEDSSNSRTFVSKLICDGIVVSLLVWALKVVKLLNCPIQSGTCVKQLLETCSRCRFVKRESSSGRLVSWLESKMSLATFANCPIDEGNDVSWFRDKVKRLRLVMSGRSGVLSRSSMMLALASERPNIVSRFKVVNFASKIN